MAARQAYLVQWEDGTFRTVQAHSVKGAAGLFVGTYAVPLGARFGVKARGNSGDWTYYARTQAGIRKVSAGHASTPS